MSNTNEPRALTAALSQPAFVTKGGGLAMHVANRHVSRWAPEVGEPGAQRIRPLRNLGFVDRLVTPWIESAQRSASLRMFSGYMTNGMAERQTAQTSWVFPRPWYQDELDWMAAARAVAEQNAMAQANAPQMFTTRGTYVSPVAQTQLALPSALHEYVAPSLSIARPAAMQQSVSDAYSPLVPLAATNAAQVMARAVAPIIASRNAENGAARMSPGLRSVLATMLERSAIASPSEQLASRVSSYAPEMVTPPAPRPDVPVSSISSSALGESASPEYSQATAVAEQYAEQRARIVELQRVARVAAERELVARQAASSSSQAAPSSDSRVAEVRAAEVRAVEQRQAELQQRAADVAAQRGAERSAAEVARRETERVAADAERARIEERIAQRIAERQQAERLHSASRDAAARDARTAPMPMPSSVADAPRAEAPRTESRVATEIAAAVAALPPELASMVAAGIGGRPDRAVQAIAELGEALRAVELIARNTASGGSIEPTRGPRLVMPTGLGGLVSTVERTTAGSAQSRVPAAFAGPTSMPMAPVGSIGAFSAPTAPAARRELAAMTGMRVPAMAFLAAPNAPAQAGSPPAPTSAIGAAAAMTPAALSHVAWSDRWLARFAGAKATSLDVLSAASATPEMRLEMLAAAAPGTVFVAPFFDERPRAMPSIVGDAESGSATASMGEPLPTLRNPAPAQSVARFDDDAETPDDVFAAIASAATRSRATASVASSPTSAPTAAAAQTTFDRETLADLVAHAAPSAPGAGLSAGLASSPFAPALRHVLPLGAAPSFDVRALFGGGLGATYLAGLLSAATDEISMAPALPTWASWGQTSIGALTQVAPDGGELPMPGMRDVADWSPTYVAPEMPRTAATDVDGGMSAQPEITAAQAEAIAAYNAPLTTLRSALLSWDVETIGAGTTAAETRVFAPTASQATTQSSLARSMIDAMTMPMLGETAALRELGALDIAGMTAQASSYAAPGMIADRAQSWSVAQERSTSDLSFDFVSPELVLAARVYGLGPAEAAQAARLATAGPGQLTAMASAVDRTFVQALAIDSERRGERRALSTAFPLTQAGSSETSSVARESRAAREDSIGSVGGDELPALMMPTTSTFGVERRMPRGAFLWPAATTAALGLNAAAPDGEMSMSVAALELLAAQAVAELGTYASLGERAQLGLGTDETADVSTAGRASRGGAMPFAAGAEPGESDVLASAEAMVAGSRREKFQALYLALGQSPSGRSWSPAARAARALALAGRGEETVSARERASIAWDVMPMIYGLGDTDNESLSTGDAATRATRRRDELRALDPAFGVFVDSRPGLGQLSARAGEALGSYVAPGVATQTSSAASGASASSSSRGESGALLRAPTAAQELVQTGRPSGRFGGGEQELPAWFEQAARKMLEDRGSVSDGISLAELTLVQTAAPQQIAASSRHEGGHTQPVAPSPGGTTGAEKEKIDIEKLANDVYREILALMDVARARNGEPYL